MKAKRKQGIPDMFLLIVAIWINSLTIGRPVNCTILAAQHPMAMDDYDENIQMSIGNGHIKDSVEDDEGVVGVGNIKGIENREMHGFFSGNEDSHEHYISAQNFDLLNRDELLDIRDDTAVNSIPEKDLPKFGEPLQNVTVPVGREAVLQCVVDNLQTYKIAWLRVDTQTILTIQNHVITKNHRMSITFVEKRAWVLRIRDVKESDKGWYMCQINTDPMKSQVGYIDVVVPPDIIDQSTSADMVVREGTNVVLKCAATGSPQPTITWRREGGELIPTANGTGVIAYNGSFLPINKVNRLNMGAYLCIASNGIPPTVSKRMMLIVHFPPMISIQNQLVGAAIGLNITIECHSEAHPKAINYWMKNDTIIVPGERFVPENIEHGYKITMRLNINDVDSKDFGSYRCVAKNSLGDTDGTIKLYHIPRSTAATTIVSTPVARTTPAVTISWHKDQRFYNKNNKIARNKAKTHIQMPTPSLNYDVLVNSTSTLWNVQDYTRPASIIPGREQYYHKKTSQEKDTSPIINYSDLAQGRSGVWSYNKEYFIGHSYGLLFLMAFRLFIQL